MKTLTLTRQQARHLLISLEQSGKAMDETELRRFGRKLADPLYELIETYDSRIQDIAREYSAEDQMTARNELLEQLNDTDGNDIVSHDFEDADFGWLMEIWESLKFSPERFARRMVLNIGDALDNAITPSNDNRKLDGYEEMLEAVKPTREKPGDNHDSCIVDTVKANTASRIAAELAD